MTAIVHVKGKHKTDIMFHKIARMQLAIFAVITLILLVTLK